MKRSFIKEYDDYTLYYMIESCLDPVNGEIMLIEARTEPSIFDAIPDDLNPKYREYLQRDLIQACERFAELKKDELRQGEQVFGLKKIIWEPPKGQPPRGV